ncbi:hypothetical protein [Nocardia alni]|uniref:hypothetical protein n=1 Tax=Nocardia alni TaxID=2815723 RepID=UPI001C231A8D|nr:hypothetical protein [Nocardia alni]
MRISKLRLAIVGVVGAALFTGAGAGVAYAFQPHMLTARGDLQSAQGELQQAVPDKAGHRVAAANLVQQAINQVNLGIQAGAQ